MLNDSVCMQCVCVIDSTWLLCYVTNGLPSTSSMSAECSVFSRSTGRQLPPLECPCASTILRTSKTPWSELVVWSLYAWKLIVSQLVRQGDHSSWKVMEFSKTIFQAWKVMENSQGHGKSWKMMMMFWNFLLCR